MKKFRNCGIVELRDLLDKGEITGEELFKEAVSLASKYQDEYNSFVTIIDSSRIRKRESLLSEIPYSLKDNFSTSGILTTGSSNILKDYVPVFDSTVYKKLKSAGATLVGKTVLDELAMGGSGTTGHTGVVKNPWNKECLMGGSSAGSAASVALGIVPFSIGSDTGDSVRKPASFGGIVGFKPTYGRISRYGMFSFASSLDHVGIFSRCVRDAAIVTDILKGYDRHDMVTLQDDGKCYLDLLDKDITGRRLFYIKELCGKDAYGDDDKELSLTLEKFHEMLEKIRESGIEVIEVSMEKELLEAIYPTYLCISSAEATSNNSNLTGIAFGSRVLGSSVEEVMFKTRTEGFSEFIKRRFVLGSYVLQKENQEKLFLNAQRVRRIIVSKMNEFFKDYDGMIAPCSGGGAPKFLDDVEKLSDRYLILENHLAIGNFGGFPSITIPYTFVQGMPVGLNITGRVKEDDVVLNMASKIEKITGFRGIYSEVGDSDV